MENRNEITLKEKLGTALRKGKAGFNAAMRTALPEALNYACPGLGSLCALGIAYDDQRAAQNIEILIEQLRARVNDLEEKIKSVTDTTTANKIMGVVLQVMEERDENKIGFFASVIAGELLHVTLDWGRELQEEFRRIIGQLSTPEMIILEAMYKRKRGEAISLSSPGKTWLEHRIVNNETTLAWIDSLVRKGLVADASVEKVQTGFGSPGANSVKSRSAFCLSDLGRSMIDYMHQSQSIRENSEECAR